MKGSIIQHKGFEFAIKIANVFKSLQADRKEFILSEQLVRSGISIRTNVDEACGGKSRKDFTSKISMAHKKCGETKYRIRLLKATHYLNDQTAQELQEDADEPNGILSSILITPKQNENIRTKKKKNRIQATII